MHLLIHDFTYHAKTEIKALGGKWNPTEQGWEMPTSEAHKRGLLACLKAELKYLEAEENDPENVGGDLDSAQRMWMTCNERIKQLEAELG